MSLCLNLGGAEERVAENTASRDHVWVANALFTESGRLKSQLQMWWHPPQPALVYSQPPATPNVFFHHRFFLWMPYRMLAYPFVCSQLRSRGRQVSLASVELTAKVSSPLSAPLFFQLPPLANAAFLELSVQISLSCHM